MQIRPEDFRHAWPHALAQILSEAGEITKQLDASGKQTRGLVSQIPAITREVHEIFDATKISLVESQKELDDVAKKHINLLEGLAFDIEARHNELVRQMDYLNALKTDLALREAKLKEFEAAGFFRRVFWSK